MSVMKALHEKKDYEVKFTAADDALAPGALYVMLVGWVPTANGAPPAAVRREIAPGATGSVTGTAPACADAHALRVDISVPPGGGGGALAVAQEPPADEHAVTASDVFRGALIP